MKKIKSWKELNKIEKRKVIISNAVLIILLIIVGISFVFYNKLHGEESIFNKELPNVPWIINQLYHMIPKVINTISILVVCTVIQKLTCFIIAKLFNKDDKRLTISQMIQSFIKWITLILIILLILSEWGVNTATLLASAGVLTLVIGLGAQSLVADIVAGIFIVFDSEYEVNDIVNFDGFRGVVKEVGMRTTKIEDSGGNIKIINNSEIKQIINQTKELSLASCVISIDYNESLQRVESIIANNLEDIAKNIPLIIKGPIYKGVTSLSASSVDLLLVASCKEDDIFQVQRDLNRQFKLLAERFNINLAFPQLVIHKGDDSFISPSKDEIDTANKLASTYIDIPLDIYKDDYYKNL